MIARGEFWGDGLVERSWRFVVGSRRWVFKDLLGLVSLFVFGNRLVGVQVLL